MLKEPFLKAIPIIETLESGGYEAFFVGGCVRDFLLKRNIRDIDIATSAQPDEVQNLFNKVIPTGIKHGTVTVRYLNESYEVTTYRIEHTYTDQRHPDEVQFIRHIEEDLKRRDFTINAIAMDKNGEIIDLFSGKKDIDKQIIRTVGNAADRFKEDPLRMVRAVRFASQLGFKLERFTEMEIKSLKHEIETIAIERILEEMVQFFKGKYVQEGWNILVETKLYGHLPVFKNNDHLIKGIPKSISSFHTFAEVIAMMHYIDHNISIAEWTKRWKCSNKTKNNANNLYSGLIELESNGVNPWLLYNLDVDHYATFLHLTKLLKINTFSSYEDFIKNYEQLPIHKRSDIKLKGDDILSLYPTYRKGPWIQKIFLQLERKIVLGELLNDKIELKEWILCHPPEVS